MAAIIFWLIFRVVPMMTPRIKEKPVRDAYHRTVVILSTARNISPPLRQSQCPRKPTRPAVLGLFIPLWTRLEVYRLCGVEIESDQLYCIAGLNASGNEDGLTELCSARAHL
jgi:hypothetical protein